MSISKLTLTGEKCVGLTKLSLGTALDFEIDNFWDDSFGCLVPDSENEESCNFPWN